MTATKPDGLTGELNQTFKKVVLCLAWELMFISVCVYIRIFSSNHQKSKQANLRTAPPKKNYWKEFWITFISRRAVEPDWGIVWLEKMTQSFHRGTVVTAAEPRHDGHYHQHHRPHASIPCVVAVLLVPPEISYGWLLPSPSAAWIPHSPLSLFHLILIQRLISLCPICKGNWENISSFQPPWSQVDSVS